MAAGAALRDLVGGRLAARGGRRHAGHIQVPEAIAAREWKMEVVGISTVTAIEGTASGIDPAEVVAVAERTASRCGPLLVELVTKGALR